MSKQLYVYEISGLGAGKAPWSMTGEIEGGLDVIALTAQIMQASFEKLTSGKAVFGEPGKGCKGPYTITRLAIRTKAGARHGR